MGQRTGKRKNEVPLKATREKYQKTKANKPRAAKNVFNGNCLHCEKRGHKKDECFRLSKEKKCSNWKDHAFTAITAQNKNDWLLGTGASCHMGYDKAEFTSMLDLERPVRISIANGTTVEAISTGSIEVSLSNGETSPSTTYMCHIWIVDYCQYLHWFLVDPQFLLATTGAKLAQDLR